MAAIGFEDPRWIVKEMGEEGKNAGFWHWEERDALPWCKKRLNNFISKILFKNIEEIKECKITKVTKCKGEANVMNRKKKLFSLYELELELEFESKILEESTKNEKIVKGKIILPYLSNENDVDDFEFRVKMNQDKDEKYRYSIYKHSKSELIKLISTFLNELKSGGSLKEHFESIKKEKKKVEEFEKKLQEKSNKIKEKGNKTIENKNDVNKNNKNNKDNNNNNNNKNDPNENNNDEVQEVTNEGEGYQFEIAKISKKKKEEEEKKKKNESKKIVYKKKILKKSFVLKYTFNCPVDQLMDCFLNDRKISAYTQSKCILIPKEGEKFDMLNGLISGEITKIIQGKSIHKKWRMNDWNKGDYSNVVLKFTFKDGKTILTLSQSEIPHTDKFGSLDIEKLKFGWKNNFFKRIKIVFGFGSIYF